MNRTVIAASLIVLTSLSVCAEVPRSNRRAAAIADAVEESKPRRGKSISQVESFPDVAVIDVPAAPTEDAKQFSPRDVTLWVPSVKPVQVAAMPAALPQPVLDAPAPRIESIPASDIPPVNSVGPDAVMMSPEPPNQSVIDAAKPRMESIPVNIIPPANVDEVVPELASPAPVTTPLATVPAAKVDAQPVYKTAPANFSIPVRGIIPAYTRSAEYILAHQCTLTPTLEDGVNDAAVFGPGAAEVTIRDAKNRRVFNAVHRPGMTPIRWNCKGLSGKIVDEGVYFAVITTQEGKEFHQSFTVLR